MTQQVNLTGNQGVAQSTQLLGFISASIENTMIKCSVNKKEKTNISKKKLCNAHSLPYA